MTAYDLAASPLPMIAPVVSMRQTGWKQKQQVFAAIRQCEVNSLLVPLVIALFAVTNFCPQ